MSAAHACLPGRLANRSAGLRRSELQLPASTGLHGRHMPAGSCSASKRVNDCPAASADAVPVGKDTAADCIGSMQNSTSRRLLLCAPACAALASGLLWPRDAAAVQGLTAGRIPGISKEVDAEGFRTYNRPEGKSGGHGVGWSEIPQYSFRVPDGWDEVAVSIADLGGTEIDMRMTAKDEGSLEIVVAPVLRFMDVGFNADVRIEDIGPPDRIIAGFHPELFGAPLQSEDDVLGTAVTKGPDGLTYYRWELRPHRLVAATAFKNRMFIMAVTANGRQWRKAEDHLRAIQASFSLPPVKA